MTDKERANIIDAILVLDGLIDTMRAVPGDRKPYSIGQLEHLVADLEKTVSASHIGEARKYAGTEWEAELRGAFRPALADFR